MTNKPEVTVAEAKSAERRALLKKVGRFAAVTAPAVTLLLAAMAKPKKALAVSGTSSRQFKDTEGAADGVALLAALPGNGVAIDMIDGVGICLAAIKALSAKVDCLETKLQVGHRKRAA
jgi:hypothetical protein